MHIATSFARAGSAACEMRRSAPQRSATGCSVSRIARLSSTAAASIETSISLAVTLGRWSARLESDKDLLNRREELVGIEGFHEPTGRTGVLALRLALGGGLVRQEEEGHGFVVRLAAELTDERDAVDVGDVDVGDDEIEALRARELQRLHDVFRLFDLIAGTGERGAYDLTHRRGIIYGED